MYPDEVFGEVWDVLGAFCVMLVEDLGAEEPLELLTAARLTDCKANINKKVNTNNFFILFLRMRLYILGESVNFRQVWQLTC